MANQSLTKRKSSDKKLHDANIKGKKSKLKNFQQYIVKLQ